MAVVAAFMAALIWVGGWIALIVSVAPTATGSALLVCGVIHGIILFSIAFWYAAFNL